MMPRYIDRPRHKVTLTPEPMRDTWTWGDLKAGLALAAGVLVVLGWLIW
jgi:hypothetical protein